jgi:hypothetical protein
MSEQKFLIVLFKNKKRKKILKKFVTFNRANLFFSKLMESSNNVWFDMKTENGQECEFELGLIEKTGTPSLFPTYVTDELGRNLKVEMENKDHSLIKVLPYKIEEELYNNRTGNRITTSTFFKHYLTKDGIKMISKLNNRIVFQKDDETELFSLKSVSDADRFVDMLSDRMVSLKRQDVLIVKDVSTIHRKYLYELLETSGFKKSYLYRTFTTHPSTNK